MNGRISSLLLALLVVTASLALAQERENEVARQGLVRPEIIRDDSGRVRVKLGRGGRINIDNRTTGPIVVIGWDRDVVEASATSDRGAEDVRVWVDSIPGGMRVSLKADYAEREVKEDAPWKERGGVAPQEAAGARLPSLVQADVPLLRSLSGWVEDMLSGFDSRPGEIFIEVRVPRYAEIETIRVIRSEVLVSDVDTKVVVDGSRSGIKLNRVGAAEVRTRSGEVKVEGARGLVDVITTSGAIRVRDAGADVRALSISGPIEIECARGRIDASNTIGPIAITGAGERVKAIGTYSDLRLSGAISDGGSYHLKTMSGSVEMALPADEGFTATLSSYRGGVESDFPLEGAGTAADGSPHRQLSGRHGNGQAQIILDSFDGEVRLKRMSEAERARMRQSRCDASK